MKVRLKHVDTGAFIITHDAKFGDPIAGHLEVCALERGGKDKNSEWRAAEGVYLPLLGGDATAAAGDSASGEL